MPYQMKGVFNSGRGYTPEGQIIEYQVLDTEIVEDLGTGFICAFNDTSRMIGGQVMFYISTLAPNDQQIQNAILAEYDKGAYSTYQPLAF